MQLISQIVYYYNNKKTLLSILEKIEPMKRDFLYSLVLL